MRVVGEPRRRSSIVGKLNRFLNNKISKSAYLCLGPKRFCGLTVPNYPGPSVITSSSNSIVLSYNLPADSLAQGHSFQVEKNFAFLKAKLNRTHPHLRLQRVPSTHIALPRPSSTSMAAAPAPPPVVRACFPLESKICLRRTFFQSANNSLLLSSATPRNCRYQGQKST